jgi:hypothetical protein
MRRAFLVRLALITTLIAVLSLVPRAAVQASSIGFRGGAADHYWNVDITFCKDAFKVTAVEIAHADGGTGDDKPFSLVLSRTTTLVTTPLAALIGGGVGGPNRQLGSATGYFTYTAAQAPGAPTQIILERWEHGDSNAEDDSGDFSVNDDREILTGTAANCTLITPPVFDLPPSPQANHTFTMSPGMRLSFVVEASDADGLDAVTLGASGLPPGASFPIPAPANPAVATFSWTPTQAGRHVIQFLATDSTGRSAPAYPVIIDVRFASWLPAVVAASTSTSGAAAGADSALAEHAFRYPRTPA